MQLTAVMACGPTLIESMRGVKVSTVACGAHHTLCLTSEGSVYSWGRGANGRLGQYTDNMTTPEFIVGVPALLSNDNWQAEEFELFPSSPTSSFIARTASMDCTDSLGCVPIVADIDDYFRVSTTQLTATRQTISSYNADLGLDSSGSKVQSGQRLSLRIEEEDEGDMIVNSSYDTSTEGLTGTGTGTEADSKHGLRPRPQSVPTPRTGTRTRPEPRPYSASYVIPSLPQSLLSPTHVVCIAAGFSHSVAVTACGAVFSWGCGSNGRLGHGSHCDEYTPRQVTTLYCTLFCCTVLCLT